MGCTCCQIYGSIQQSARELTTVSRYAPVAVPDICLRRRCSLASVDRGHSLRSLHPPPAALPSLPGRQFITNANQASSSAVMLGNERYLLCHCHGQLCCPWQSHASRKGLLTQGILTYCTTRALPYQCTPTGASCLSRQPVCTGRHIRYQHKQVS